jgi:hypothetical protein
VRFTDVLTDRLICPEPSQLQRKCALEPMVLQRQRD